MANSFRKTPITGNCSHSDKPGKVIANRVLRRKVKTAIAVRADLEDFVFPVLREVSNVWDFPKDGKSYVSPSSRYYASTIRK